MTQSTDSDGYPVIDKVRNARLDYSFDFKKWLQGVGDSIASASMQSDNVGAGNLDVEAATHSGGVVSAFVSGGTVGTIYALTCTITTTSGRIDARTLKINVKATR